MAAVPVRSAVDAMRLPSRRPRRPRSLQRSNATLIADTIEVARAMPTTPHTRIRA